MSTTISLTNIPKNVTSRDIEFKGMNYVMLNSDPNLLEEGEIPSDDSSVYRSVILDDNKRILCAAPFNSANVHDFME